MTDQHIERVMSELREAGVTIYSLRKNESKHLPKVIHIDEHIGAAINGRTDVGSVMMVATDRRVIFLDCKSFYTTVDELTYDVVSGVAYHVQGLFANVTLHTRVGEYHLRFVNPKAADTFVEFIEQKRLENPDGRTLMTHSNNDLMEKKTKAPKHKLNKDEKKFLFTHYLGVMSTIDRTGNVHGAAVYYVADEKGIYLVTKSETTKARNILSHQQVALTIFEEASYESLQLKGIATIETNQNTQRKVFDHIMKIRNMEDGVTLPPVTKINEGAYVIVKISVTSANYRKYK